LKPLHGGAPAARRLVRELMVAAQQPKKGPSAQLDQALTEVLALGVAQGVRFFAPAEGRRLYEEVQQARNGERDPVTWRPR
jgi:hypothetical protein